MSKKEFSADAFGDEEVAVEEAKKDVPVAMLEEAKIREDAEGNSLYSKYLEYIELLGGWDSMSNPDRKKINASFKRPGKFGAGGGQDTSKLPAAHRKALDLNKKIRDTAYAGVDDNAMDVFTELQAMNPDAKISVEVYFKNWKKFVEGLPKD